MCDAGAMTRLELSSLSSEHYPKLINECRDGCQVRVSSEWCMKSINHEDQLSFVVIRFLIIACGSHLSSSNECGGGCEGSESKLRVVHEEYLSRGSVIICGDFISSSSRCSRPPSGNVNARISWCSVQRDCRAKHVNRITTTGHSRGRGYWAHIQDSSSDMGDPKQHNDNSIQEGSGGY